MLTSNNSVVHNIFRAKIMQKFETPEYKSTANLHEVFVT